MAGKQVKAGGDEAEHEEEAARERAHATPAAAGAAGGLRHGVACGERQLAFLLDGGTQAHQGFGRDCSWMIHSAMAAAPTVASIAIAMRSPSRSSWASSTQAPSAP